MSAAAKTALTICASIVPGEPVSKARARVTKTGRVYHDRAAVAAEANIAWQAKADNEGLEPDDAHDLGVSLGFYVRTRRRLDLDNCIKAVLDSYNGVVWRDDQQVVEITARVVRGDANPRSEIVVYRVEGDQP